MVALTLAFVVLAVVVLSDEVARGKAEAVEPRAHATPSSKTAATEEATAVSHAQLGKPRRAGVGLPKTPATETWFPAAAHTTATARFRGALHQ